MYVVFYFTGDVLKGELTWKVAHPAGDQCHYCVRGHFKPGGGIDPLKDSCFTASASATQLEQKQLLWHSLKRLSSLPKTLSCWMDCPLSFKWKYGSDCGWDVVPPVLVTSSFLFIGCLFTTSFSLDSKAALMMSETFQVTRFTNANKCSPLISNL